MTDNPKVEFTIEGKTNQVQIISLITQVMELYFVPPANAPGSVDSTTGILRDSEVNGIVGWFAQTYNRPPRERIKPISPLCGLCGARSVLVI